MDGERQEPVARLARERAQGQPLAVAELDLYVRLIGRVRRRVALDLPEHAGDEVVERRLGRAGNPKIRTQKSFASSNAAPRSSRSIRSSPFPSTSRSSSASRAISFVIAPSCLTCATSRTRLRMRFAI